MRTEAANNRDRCAFDWECSRDRAAVQCLHSTFTAGSIAHEIWKGLGLPDKMGYWQLGGHNHCQFPSAQRAILEAYVKKFLVGGGIADTNVLRSDGAKADLARWMKWTAPALE
ncbi:hypothetical protein WME79_05410 [Sorangium sp. So ce726]|uniref:hypothetical protein n=1 Tax=Sorangium sp. So ce726 TaxID=3133319 RepID=UPI003F637EE7